MSRRFPDFRYPRASWTLGDALSAGLATAFGAIFLIAGIVGAAIILR